MQPERKCTAIGCDKKHYARGFCANHYHYWFMENRGGELGERQETGNRGEQNTVAMFRDAGRAVQKAPYRSPYDCIVDGWRIDIKTSRFSTSRPSPGWFIRFHTHGLLDESNRDFYVARLEEIPYYKEKALYLAYRAPVNKQAESISLMTLLTGGYIENTALFQALCDGTVGQKSHLESVDAA